ncbi:Holliday junction endonuclease RuvC [Seinonella peptonophila]|uniref:Crossover junction endodeoxyribonuclease RuvC n=1 Tax=Seinonella peptonophila TaxID=112248 RepID=A0A1M4TS38_9BACL|nr:crossover junction endodeoxyribonuclease RuvC [Seinonella peptonophila]SHE47117.1 Holliday junction endonuclease RuvC [Seinonella peptonophila]
MRIMGIDPGLAIVGFGILDQRGNMLKPVDFGCIKTETNLSLPTRLKQIYDACSIIMDEHQPDVVAVEKLFFNRNVTTAFTVGQARGVILLAAEEAGIPITEYTPLQVKMAVTGYGQAEKKQIQEMVKMLLSLPRIPKPDDVADALAVAICEAHSGSLMNE